MNSVEIQKKVQFILKGLPQNVILEAAAKTRNAKEARAVVDAGISVLGYNYLQEAKDIQEQLGDLSIQWHMIGHLQKNKVNKAAQIFDLIETIDSFELAALLDNACAKLDKIMPIFVQVNSGRETQKSGAYPEDVESVVREIAQLPHLKIKGLMTMGPWVDDAEKLRPFFRETRALFDELVKKQIPNTDFQHVSMGMSASHKVAIEEGATIIRLGSILFGPRTKK